MRSVAWDRPARIASIREDVWRFVSKATEREDDVILEAAALLQMGAPEVRTLATIHFIASPEVGALLDSMPQLVRRLKTTTRTEEERTAERVRGAIRWGPTLSSRASTGLPHLYVTAPARRAFQTPENRVLVYALDTIRAIGRRTGWHRASTPGLGSLVRDRVADAERWLRTRMLAEIHPAPPSAHVLAKVRTGRAGRLYRPALDVIDLHRRYVRRLDRLSLKQAIQDNALVTSKDDVLLELICAFAIESALDRLGWNPSQPGLMRGGLLLEGHRSDSRIAVYYQTAPRELANGSLYRTVQDRHPFEQSSDLRPDFVVRVDNGQERRWLLVEVKGVKRAVARSARAALQDLLAYRRAYEPVLGGTTGTYGLGIAWGVGLQPATDSEIALCTPETVEQALDDLLRDA
jgi:hypothetical protein